MGVVAFEGGTFDLIFYLKMHNTIHKVSQDVVGPEKNLKPFSLPFPHDVSRICTK